MSINLADRIKELSYTIGTGNMVLSGPVRGFSSFSSTYSHNSEIFYAITDGTNYEIGSGIYQRADYDSGDSITTNQLVRFPIKSTNSNAKVNFVEGTKEVYVTYPATHSVYMGSGLSGLTVPQSSGLAFWGSDHVLDYDSSLVWDKTNNRLGINKTNPAYPIDVGGVGSDSVIRASGLIVSSSGIYFPAANNGDVSYGGGRQLTHYVRNETDKYAYDNSLISNLTGSDSVIQLSGSANQYILLKKQNAGLVFASPSDTCSPPCGPAYPSFRPLVLADIPNLDLLYPTKSELTVINNKVATVSGMIVSTSGLLRNDIINVSGLLRNDLTTVSGILTSASGLLYTNFVTISGIAVKTSGDLFAISGYFQNKTQNIYASSTSTSINCAPRSDAALNINNTGTNSPLIYGNVISCSNNITNNGSYSSNGSYIVSSTRVAQGITNSGTSICSTMINHRNLLEDNDSGILSNLYGMAVSYGHNSAYAQTPKTNNAVGLNVSCYALAGTVTNAYDITLTSSGTKAVNHWGIYQESPNNNYFSGSIGIQTPTPTAKLDVNSDTIRLRLSKTPSGSSSPGNVGDICWDADFMYICVGINTWKRTAISTWAGDTAIPSNDNSANYTLNANWGGSNYGNITTVGSNGRASAYGTYDQGGNASEINDGDGISIYKGYRDRGFLAGGNASYISTLICQRNLDIGGSNASLGFRVASSYSFVNPLDLPNFVVVGDINNAADTTDNGCANQGSVSYMYAIGKYEVTIAEYVEFLNAVAVTDTYDLFPTFIGLPLTSDTTYIIRTGSDGSYSYAAKATVYNNKPITFMTWLRAARYVNWLHNGKPTTGSQTNLTTEDGAYTLMGKISGPGVARNSEAKYHIPTEDEWYKAAYYKGGSTNAGYWKYATQSDTDPTSVSADSIGNGITS